MTQLSWVAYYEDGTRIYEGMQNYKDIPRKDMTQLKLIDNEGKTHAEVTLNSGEVAFYRCRTHMPVLSSGKSLVWWLIGARSNHSLRLIVIKPDGTVFTDTQFQKEWYEPQWLETEIPNGSLQS